MSRRVVEFCHHCGKPIQGKLILVPNGLGTGYYVFDSLACLKASATKYNLMEALAIPNSRVDRLRDYVRLFPEWTIKTYGINVVYELIERKKI